VASEEAELPLFQGKGRKAVSFCVSILLKNPERGLALGDLPGVAGCRCFLGVKEGMRD
jgi:hypothetical protein